MNRQRQGGLSLRCVRRSKGGMEGRPRLGNVVPAIFFLLVAACAHLPVPEEPAVEEPAVEGRGPSPDGPVDPRQRLPLRPPADRASLRVLVLAPEVLATGDTACFAVALVNDGPAGSVVFAGGVGNAAMDLVLRTPAGEPVRTLSRDHPPPLAAIPREIGRGEAVVVARRWDLTDVRGTPSPGFERDYPPDGEYIVEGFFPASDVRGLRGAARLTVRSGGSTRTTVPDLCS
jgi:hypothetical protein